MPKFRPVTGSVTRDTGLRRGWYVERTNDSGATEIVSPLYDTKDEAKQEADRLTAQEPDPHA
jgi:hypothetical protein